MDLIFAQPAGWWALLGLPAVLAIHFLQSRHRREPIATLFLLDPLAEESRQGAVWTRLRNSRQLWLQLIAVLLFTWILLKPSWIRVDSMQSVAIVLDSSRSMQPFQERAADEVAQAARRLNNAAARTSWLVLPSDETLPVHHRGYQLDGVLDAIANWSPARPHHDPLPALRRARSMVGGDGLVIWVTDHIATNLPGGVELLAVGRPIENTGFTGFRIQTGEDGSSTWIASLLHHGVQEIERKLQTRFDDAAPSAPQTIRLAPGRLTTISGPIPGLARRGLIELDADSLPADDRVSFVVPVRKSIHYQLTGSGKFDPWARRVMDSIEAAYPATTNGPTANLQWKSFNKELPPSDAHGIFLHDGAELAPYAPPFVELHPLVEDLPWSSFLGRAATDVSLSGDDRVLVWAGDHPLVALRERSRQQQLVFAFDPSASNADRLPAVVLTLHRFIERIREQLPQYEALNIDEGAMLALPSVTGETTTAPETIIFTDAITGVAQPLSGPPFVAPYAAGWISATRTGEALLDAGVLLIDPVEGNLKSAASRALSGELVARQQLINSREDMLAPLWFFLLAAAVIFSWPAGAFWSKAT